MAGVKTVITSGGSMASSLSAIDIAASEKNVYAVIGVDPQAPEEDAAFIKEITERIKSNRKIIGVGEIGLDYKVSKVDKELQKKLFTQQIKVANDLDVPVVIHSRGAIEDTIKAVNEAKPKKAMFHYYEGDEKQALHLAELGYMISIPPIESSRRKRVINSLQLSNIVVETDSPVVGKTPIDVIKTVGWISQIKGLTFKDTAVGTTQNVKKLFNI